MFPIVDTEEMVSVSVKMRPDLLAAIEQAIKVNGEGRGQFIRNSIKASLEKRNMRVKADSHLAPDRTGVGGKPTHKNYPAHQEEVSVMEESRDLISAEDAALKAQEIMGAAQLAGKAGAAMLDLKPRAASPSGKKAGPSGPAHPAYKPRPTPPKPAPTARES